MPTLRQLEYLVAVAETHHFRRAAERVNVTQPTLSEQLRALEDRLGVQLVERSRSNVVLTPIGVEVVEIGRRMLHDARHIRDITGGAGRGLAGVIRLGLPLTIGPYLLPRVVPELHALHPQLKLYVREELPHALPRGLIEGQHDIIIAPLPVEQAGLEHSVIFEETLYLALPTDHPLAQSSRIEPEDLKGIELVALGPGHQLREIVVELAKEVGAKMRFDYEGTSLDTLREMMATGLGVTILPGLYVHTVLRKDSRFKTFTIEGRDLRRTIAMFWRKTKSPQKLYQRLADLFRDIGGKLETGAT
jgi:LysR family hydrogen peroxide-inducible transcriptional activator